MNFTAIITSIIDKEKGYVDHPSDRGGPTNFGITEAVARQNGFVGDMKDLPKSVAEDVYLNRYILAPGFAKISLLSERIAEELIDTGVNMGPATASIMFQRLLNALNVQGTRYADIFVDGNIGPASIDAFRKFLAFRGLEGIEVFYKALNHIQGWRYMEIAEKSLSQEDFFYGWIKNRT